MPYPDTVETARLTLRRICDEDEQGFAAIWADPHVWRALRPGAPFDPQHAARRFRHHVGHWEAHGFGLWMLEDRASGQIAGLAGASHPDFVGDLADEIEIGWSLRQPFWGCGIATEAAQAAVVAAFEHLHPSRLISLIDPANVRSIAVAERVGMRQAGLVVHDELGIELRLYVRDAPAPS